MDPATTFSIFGKLLEHGIAAVGAGAFFWLFLRERKRVDELSDKIYDIGLKSVESQNKATTATEQSSELIKSALSLIRGGRE